VEEDRRHKFQIMSYLAKRALFKEVIADFRDKKISYEQYEEHLRWLSSLPECRIPDDWKGCGALY
jgi:hypothetical protein